MSSEQTKQTGPKGRRAFWWVAAGGWLLAAAASGCGITASEQSTLARQEAAVLGGTTPMADAGTEDAGTVPWRGQCSASSDCDQAAASLCGDNMEMYCKFPLRKDGGTASVGTCECREKQMQVMDAGVIGLDASIGTDTLP